MKQIYLLLIFLVASVSSVIAQTGQRPGEAFIQQANFNHNDAAKQFTSDFVSMFSTDLGDIQSFDGQSNIAFVNLWGNGNNSSVLQSGWGNIAMVNILGDRNRTGLRQSGNGNQFILNLEGSNSIVDGLQAGKDNTLRMDIIGNSHDQSFIQTGTNLSLELINSGNTGGVPMHVEQKGNGGSVIIENY